MKASTTKTTAPTTETPNGMKATALKTASGMKASASMETATHAAMEAAATAAMETAAAATARRHNVGCKHSKCCSRQQRDRDFTEHD